MSAAFDVWAPYAGRVRLSVDAETTVEMRQRRRRLVDATTEPLPVGEVDYGYLLDDDDDAAARPALAPAAGRRARAVAHLRPGGVRVDRPAPGPDASSPAPSSTSCTSAPSRPRARSTPRSAGSTTCVDLGVDLVELLPVNAFNGTHNWGYDGVLWFAVHEEYGGPAAYQRFVDGCHAAGLGVVQDVVYNHFGPSGQLPAARTGRT